MDHDDIMRVIELALAETDSEVARSLFYGAWRCNELRRRNERLEALIERFDSDQDVSSGDIEVIEYQLPDNAHDNSGSAGVEYIRALAKQIENDQSRKAMDEISDTVTELQVRNCKRRFAAEARIRAIADREDWSSWCEEVKGEIAKQNECYCSGEFPPVCPRCQDDQGRLRSFMALLASRAAVLPSM